MTARHLSGILLLNMDDIQLIHQAVSFKLTYEAVTLPNGISTHWSVVRHNGAACVLPIDGDDVILVRSYRPPIRAWMLEIPGGGIDGDEPPLDAARRELREEAGFTARHITQLGGYRSVQGFSDFKLYYFCANGLAQVGQELDAHEVSEPVRLPFTELLAMLQAGDLTDSQIPMTLFLALVHGALPDKHRDALLAMFTTSNET